MDVFVDTSAFYALADGSDACHAQAVDYFAEACTVDQFFSSEYVLVETWGLLRSKIGKRAADEFWDWMLRDLVHLLGVDRWDLVEARGVSYRFEEQTYSLVDCVSFRLMARYGIQTAFAFDHHFRTVRMNDKAFRVVP